MFGKINILITLRNVNERDYICTPSLINVDLLGFNLNHFYFEVRKHVI